uniref:Uncharacterized protein n=1 Tax=Caenorhabditis japonica TaxID=281687 RepID=A0A8R1IHC9_CAEJA
MRLQDGQCRSRAMGRCPVLLKDKWTTSKVPSKNSNRRRRNLKASSDLSTSEASLEQEFNGRTMRRTFHSSAIWRISMFIMPDKRSIFTCLIVGPNVCLHSDDLFRECPTQDHRNEALNNLRAREGMPPKYQKTK